MNIYSVLLPFAAWLGVMFWEWRELASSGFDIWPVLGVKALKYGIVGLVAWWSAGWVARVGLKSNCQ